jgi:ketosteroid isomerase-like protein
MSNHLPRLTHMRFLHFTAALLPLLAMNATADGRSHSGVEPGLRRPVAAHAPSDSADVVGAVEAFHAALAAGDSAAVLRLLAPDVVIQESGGVETRADYAQHHLAGDIQFARAVPSVRSPLRVTLAGDVAWTSGASTTKGMWRDRTINSVGAELMVLARTSGKWQIRAIHWSSHTPRS